MILFYSRDVDERIKLHNYFRGLGIFLESVPPSEFARRSYLKDAEAALIIGEIPPQTIVTANPDLPIITIGKTIISDSIPFEDYRDSALHELLRSFRGIDNIYVYRDLLFSTEKRVIFLGYEMKLTQIERALLQHLVKNAEREVSARELTDICLGDIHADSAGIAKYIASINRKAFDIGGREMIATVGTGMYKIRKYI